MALDPLTAALDLGNTLIDRIFPDKVAAANAKMKLLAMRDQGELQQIMGQLQINQAEASNPHLFVSGARAFIIWVCGSACAWNWIGISVFKVVFAMFGHPLNVSPADVSQMEPILFTLIGAGTHHIAHAAIAGKGDSDG
jgi:hypothetical protein